MTAPFKEITTSAEADALDSDQVVAGYRAGWRDQPNYTRTEQAYWHGYLNGQVDSGRMEASPAQRAVAKDAVANGMFQQIFGARN
jgi:hypothetical protein